MASSRRQARLRLEALDDRVVPSVAQPFAVGAGPFNEPTFKLLNADGSVRVLGPAYDVAFTGGVRVATGDFNGDGVPDIVTGPGPGGGPHVKVLNGTDGTPLRSFMAYDVGFRGGVFVAVGDVNHDGVPDVITGAGAGAGPHVKVFSGKDLSLLTEFMVYGDGFTGGVSVAAGDFNGDGYADIVTGAGAGGGPHVMVWSGKDGTLLRSFMAYSQTMTSGVMVGAGDVTGDGVADVITGPGVGGGPLVRVFDGATGGNVIREITADSPPPYAAGNATVAAVDVNGDGRVEILIGAGQFSAPNAWIYGPSLTPLASHTVFDPGFLGGVFVG
jgi:hypothetical protein